LDLPFLSAGEISRIQIAQERQMGTNRKTLQLFVLCLVFTFYSCLLIPRTQYADFGLTDYFRFYQSAQFYFQGKSIYTELNSSAAILIMLKNGSQAASLHPNLNSPLHTLTIFPFALLSYKASYLAWSFFSLGIGLLALHLFVNNAISPERRSQIRPGLWILLLVYFPSIVNSILGQYGFVVLLLTVLLWTNGKRRKITAGVILGVSICLKSFFGIFLIFFACRKQWKLLSIACGTFLFCNLIGLAIFGFQDYRIHIVQLALIPQFVNASWNASLMGFYSRIFGGATNTPLIQHPNLGHAIIYGFSLLLVLLIVWISRSTSDEISFERYDLGFAVSTVAMLLISPYAWIYYFPCLLIPLILSWRITSILPKKFLYRIVLGASWTLTTWPTLLIPSESNKMNDPMVWFTAAGIYHYGLLSFVLILSLITYLRTSSDFAPVGT
jgi:alpha-1,2-mannosyltransferase